MDDTEKTDQFLLAALIDLTMLVAGETKAVVTEVLAKMGLTGPQANAVWQLDPNAAAPSMRELALKLRCDPSTVTSMADSLETKKLITRRIDPHNRRVKIICLSAKGRLIRQKLVDAHDHPVAGGPSFQGRKAATLQAVVKSGQTKSYSRRLVSGR